MNRSTATQLTPAAAETPHVRRETDGPIAILTLDRPGSRNALSEAMLAELSAHLAAVSHDKSVRAVVIAGNGPAFSAGHDLKEITAHRKDPDGGRAYVRDLMRTCSTVMQDIQRLPQPVIAAIETTATAAGCQLVATCDLAVAGQTARFATPGVHIGLFCSTPMVALTRNVAPKHAMEMLLTGEAISADEAHRIGLVNRVVAPGRARDEAIALARQIASQSALIVKMGKEAFYRQIDMTLAAAYDYASEVMLQNMLARDAEEGIGAFIEKREPKWEDS